MTKLHVPVVFLKDICLSESPFSIIKSSWINEWPEGMQFEFIMMAYIYIYILPMK